MTCYKPVAPRIDNAGRRNACQRHEALGLKGQRSAVASVAALAVADGSDTAAAQVTESGCHELHRRTPEDQCSDRAPDSRSKTDFEEVSVRAMTPGEHGGHRHDLEYPTSDSHWRHLSND